LPGIGLSTVTIGIDDGAIEAIGIIPSDGSYWLTPGRASKSNLAPVSVIGVADGFAMVCEVLLLFATLSSAWMVTVGPMALVAFAEEEKTDVSIVESVGRDWKA
jgi:hypothetical protein